MRGQNGRWEDVSHVCYCFVDLRCTKVLGLSMGGLSRYIIDVFCNFVVRVYDGIENKILCVVMLIFVICLLCGK